MGGLNDGTYGGKADIPDRGWFTRDLGAPVSITRVFWIVRGLFHGPPVTTGTLLSSEDGVTWTRFWEDCWRGLPRHRAVLAHALIGALGLAFALRLVRGVGRRG
jgi:hypothetical protein